MGWWSTDIMGGDKPLDFEDSIYEICKVEKFPEEGGIAKIPSKTLMEHLTEIMNMIEKADDVIGYQVLAVLIMNAGAPISEDTRRKIYEACDNDDWAKGDSDRRDSIINLKNAVMAYDGKTPIVITSKGLFEVMAEKLNPDNN